MMNALDNAASGLRAQQTRLDTIGHNIANVNSVGYKANRVDFMDTLYGRFRVPVGDAMEANLLHGTGVRVAGSDKDFSEGYFETTERLLDFAIDGEGFFVVEDIDGTRLYTRNGNFHTSIEEDGHYLVTSEGKYVLDDNGEHIRIPYSGKFSVGSGGVLVDDNEAFANLAIVTFPNKTGLDARGETCFVETGASGAPEDNPIATIRQGYLEGSNVNLAQELTLLIRTQRAFTLASEALRTADDMEGLANNMR